MNLYLEKYTWLPVTRIRIGGKRNKNRRGRKKKSAGEASREVVWKGKRVVEPGGRPLMTPVRPPAINMSLKFQHFSKSSYYVAFVKKICEFEMKP